MALAALIPCQGCGTAIPRAGRCDDCTTRLNRSTAKGQPESDEEKERRAEARKYQQKQYDRERGSAASRGYDRRWRRARVAYLRQNPLCVHCQSTGRTQVARVVDHIIPHRGNRQLFWDRSNWQSLCTTHHNIKTRRGE